MKESLLIIRCSLLKSPLPIIAKPQCNNEPYLKWQAQRSRRTIERKCRLRLQCPHKKRNEQYRWCPCAHQPSKLARAWDQIPNRGIFSVEMNDQRRNEPQPEAQKRPCKAKQRSRRTAVVQFRIQCQQTAAEEERQRQTQKEKYALKIPLPPVSQNHHHPEEWQQRSSGQQNKAEIKEQTHGPFPGSLSRKKAAGQLPSVRKIWQDQNNDNRALKS